MNRLTVLGGSSAGVGTGQGCSSYLVQSGDTAIVLDMGPDTLQELRKHVDYRQLDAIFVSHLHMDHVLDLFAFRFMLAYNPVKAPAKIPLFLPPDGLAYMAEAAELFATEVADIPEYFSAVYDMQEYDPETMIEVRGLQVSFAPTVHLIPCWAMRIHAEGANDIVYTADTGTDAQLDDFARGAEIIVADSAAPPDASEQVKRRVHFDAVAAAEFGKRTGCGHLVLSHQWEELDPVGNAVIAAEIFTGPISIATPGLVLKW